MIKATFEPPGFFSVGLPLGLAPAGWLPAGWLPPSAAIETGVAPGGRKVMIGWDPAESFERGGGFNDGPIGTAAAR